MNGGDRVIITKTPDPTYKFFKVGDRATLVQTDKDGDWWAEFDGRTEDGCFCIEKGFSECKLITETEEIEQ